MTSVLTTEERDSLWDKYGITATAIGIVEAAVIRKLAAVVSVELTKLCTDNRGTTHYGYTEDQLTTALAAARVQMNEECAKVCEAEQRLGIDDERSYNGMQMAGAIRALLGKEAT